MSWDNDLWRGLMNIDIISCMELSSPYHIWKFTFYMAFIRHMNTMLTEFIEKGLR